MNNLILKVSGKCIKGGIKLKKVLNMILLRKKFFFYSTLRMSSMIFGLLSNIFIVRKLTVDEYGVFSIALLIVGLMTTLGFSWSSSSILYFGSKERKQYGNINKTFWARNIIIFISLVIATLLIVTFRHHINAYIGLNVWFLVILWLYVSVIENYLIRYFLAVKKQIISSLLSITAKILYIVLILIISLDVRTLMIIYIISHASVIFYVLGINRNDIGRFEFDKGWFKKVLNFSLWQLFGFSGIYLLNFGDTAVVKHFLTNTDVGIYNAAYKLFNNTASFAFVISSYYDSSVSSYFAGVQKEKIKHFFYKERLFVITISIIAHLILLIFSKPIIVTLYGVDYFSSVSIFNILMFGSMIRFITVFYMLYYNTNGKHKIQQMINICIAITNVILSIILLQFFGVKGPAYATVLTLGLSLVFSFFYCEKRIVKSWS